MKVAVCPYCRVVSVVAPFIGHQVVQCMHCALYMTVSTDGVSFEQSTITVRALLNGSRATGLVSHGAPSVVSKSEV